MVIGLVSSDVTLYLFVESQRLCCLLIFKAVWFKLKSRLRSVERQAIRILQEHRLRIEAHSSGHIPDRQVAPSIWHTQESYWFCLMCICLGKE